MNVQVNCIILDFPDIFRQAALKPVGQKKKYYAVWAGRKPGLYGNWADCKEQVKNFPGARYMSFEDESKALEALGRSPDEYKKPPVEKRKTFPTADPDHRPLIPSISVDAACSGNPGRMEYRGVITETGKQLFKVGPLEDGTVNIGEFLAIIHALALLEKEGMELPIYSDSRTALKWVNTGVVKTKLQPNQKNHKVFELIARAQKWLQKHGLTRRVLKWDTASWGEIPADFGRK